MSNKVIEDYDKLVTIVAGIKASGMEIVLTSGSFDLLHIGHAQYLQTAKEQGDFLIVGVDNDQKVKKRKGENRPVVSEKERYQMLTFLSSVDLVVPKGVDDPSMHLIKTVHPDVLVVSETTNHNPKRLEKMQRHCGRVEMLPPQATTSTSAKVRKIFTQGVQDFAGKLTDKINELLHEMTA
jgi:D-beta-D-heptose 7-phosphate kinase/D-beta-D-heptose 1-phosphate adenosyltransferase